MPPCIGDAPAAGAGAFPSASSVQYTHSSATCKQHPLADRFFCQCISAWLGSMTTRAADPEMRQTGGYRYLLLNYSPADYLQGTRCAQDMAGMTSSHTQSPAIGRSCLLGKDLPVQSSLRFRKRGHVPRVECIERTFLQLGQNAGLGAPCVAHRPVGQVQRRAWTRTG